MKRLVVDLNQKRDNIITIANAVEMLFWAWSDVKVNTIINCFRKATFQSAEADVIPVFDEEPNNLDAETKTAWQLLTDDSTGLGVTCTFNDYVEIDSDVMVCSTPTDVEIIDTIKNKTTAETDNANSGNKDEDEEETEQAIPKLATAGDAIQAVHDLRVFLRS